MAKRQGSKQSTSRRVAPSVGRPASAAGSAGKRGAKSLRPGRTRRQAAAKSVAEEPKVPRVAGPKARRAAGPKAPRAAGPKAPRAAGPRVPRAASPKAPRVAGPKTSRAAQEPGVRKAQAAHQPAEPKARAKRLTSDIPLEEIEAAYTPTQSGSKAGFRDDGRARQSDQEFGNGISIERFNEEDAFTNRSGNPRVGTHGRTRKPDERHREVR